MTITAILAIGAFLLSAYGTYDLFHRRMQGRKKSFTDADRSVVTSAVELIEPYRVRVRELVEYVAELETKLKDANRLIDKLTDEVRELRNQVGAMRDTIED